MKLAIVVDGLAVGGAERQAILCVSELRKLGHAADLIYYRPEVEIQYRHMLQEHAVTPIPVHAKGFAGTCRELRRLFRKEGYQLVHGFKMAAELYVAFAGTWAGVPHRFGGFRNVYNLSWKYRLLHCAADKLLHGWIVNSEAAAEAMSRLAWIPRAKFKVLPNGYVNEALESSLSNVEAKARLGLRADALVVSMVARLEVQKNHRMLINVVKQIGPAFPQARFLVVGKGSLDRSLKDHVHREGIGDRLLFLGQRSDIGDILAATDISVLTSNCEGLPNALIEAMAAGKPVVSTEYYGANELMKHGQNALLSRCEDVDGFAENLRRLLEDASLRSQLGRNAKDFANRAFSPEAMGRNLESIYSERCRDLRRLRTTPAGIALN